MADGMRNSEAARDNQAAYAYARDNGHLEFVAKAKQCDEFFAGNQWESSVRRRLELLGKPVLTINKVLSTIAAIWGEQLSHRADISFRPSSGGQPETAESMDKLWLHTVNSNNYDWIEAQMAAEGFIRSRGFIDLRAEFGDHLRGEARIKLLNSKNVLVDPDASSYDPDDWNEVFLTKWLTRRDIEMAYGTAAANEVQAMGDASSEWRYDMSDWLPDTFGGDNTWGGYDSYIEGNKRRIYRFIERQYKETKYAEHFANVETGDTREIPSTWDRNRISYVMQQYGLETFRKRVEKIRWTTSSGHVTVHDSISPYKHFTPIPYFPFFLHGKTIGIVENMLDPQRLLNKSISQELHVINTTANSGWIVKNGQLTSLTTEELEERGAEDGLVIEVSGDVNTDIKKITPNQIPQGLDRVTYKADEALKEVSMVSDSMRGFDRADVAAKAIRAKQMRGTVSLASPFNNLDQTRRLLARNMVDLWQYYYTEPRVLQITAGNLAEESEELTLNYVNAAGDVVNDLTVGEYSVVVSTVPARDQHEQTQFEEALRLRTEAGVALPDDVMIEHSHLNRKSELAKRIKEQNGGGEPSQEEQQLQQQLQQLEMRLKEADAEEKEASAQLKQANAALAAARAQSELMTASQGGSEVDQGAAQLALDREELALKRSTAAEELRLKRLQTVAEIQIKRETTAEELRLKREAQAADIELKKKMASQKPTPTAGAKK